MTKLYTLQELFTNKVITNSPTDFLNEEKNIPKYYKEVFSRMADGTALVNLDKLSLEETKQYDKDVTSLIYQPELLKLIWSYRLEVLNNVIDMDLVDKDIVRKNISEIYRYVEVYSEQIRKYKEFESGRTNEKPDYAFKPDWPVKASNAIAGIKKDLNDLYLANKLPETLLLSTDNSGLGVLVTGFDGHGYDEINVVDALNRIGIMVNAEDLVSNKVK